MRKAVASKPESGIVIAAPKFERAVFTIVGDAPFVQNAFPQKIRDLMRERQEQGDAAKKGRKRDPKDFQACFVAAQHISTEGWGGHPAPAFRAAMISACRTVGFHMTRAKISVFVEPDGFDKHDGTPLCRITKGTPAYVEHYVRLESGVTDIRPRPMWKPGWEMTVRVRWDADQFSLDDVTNLLLRAGMQVGVGEGRPDSRNSGGMGWGTFQIKSVSVVKDRKRAA
jgi:hypothetical protein